jgi:RNA polymerase sigma factor (sigma-70 family)
MPPSGEPLDLDRRMLPIEISNPDALFDAYYADVSDSTPDALSALNNKVRGTALCSPEEEIAYAIAIQAGKQAALVVEQQGDAADQNLKDIIATGEEARLEFFERNLRLASWVARMSMNVPGQTPANKSSRRDMYAGAIHSDLTVFASSPMPLADRVQEASIGLLKAVETFVPVRKSNGEYGRFSTYAMYSVEATLVTGIYKYGVESGARYPQEVAQTQTAIRRSETHLIQRNGYGQVTDEAIAADIDRPHDQVKTLRALRHSHRTVSLDSESPSGMSYDQDPDDEVLYLQDLTAADDNTSERILTDEIADSIEAILASLPDREAEVLRLRYGIGTDAPQTLEAVSQIFSLTRERIRQIQSKTLERIRDSSASEKLALLLQPEKRDTIRARNTISEHVIIAARNERRAAIERAAAASPAQARQGVGRNQNGVSNNKLFTRSLEIKQAREARQNEYDYAALSTALMNNAAAFRYTGSQMTSLKLVNATIRKIYRDSELRTLNVRPLTKLWHNDIEALIDSVGGIEHFNTDVFSLVFSGLLADCALNAKEEIVLTVPEVLDGELNRFASEFGYGRLKVIGSLGDRAGESMGNGAQLTVEGSVGDLAGTLMSGNAKMYVTGSCGSQAGYRMRAYSSLTIEGEVGPRAAEDLQGRAKVRSLLKEKLIAQAAFEAIKPTPTDFMTAVRELLGHTIEDTWYTQYRTRSIGAKLNDAVLRSTEGDVKGLEFFVYGAAIPRKYHKHHVFVALDGSLVSLRPYQKRIDEPFHASVVPSKYFKTVEVLDLMGVANVQPGHVEAASAEDQLFIIELLRRFAARNAAEIIVEDVSFHDPSSIGDVPRLKLKRRQTS